MSIEFEDRTEKELLRAFYERLSYLEEKPSQDLQWFDWLYDLKDIVMVVRKFGVEKDRVRALLQKIILTTNPVSGNASYVFEHALDLAHTPSQFQALERELNSAEEKKRKIEAKVATGDSAWQAHARANQRNILNPFIVGFYQDSDGHMSTLYGPRFFKSKRQVENSFMASRSEDKEVNLLTTWFEKIQPTQFLRSKYWELLPLDLRQHLEKGEILVTGYTDIYNFADEEIKEVTDIQHDSTLIEVLDKKIAIEAEESSYFLLYYSDYASDDTGRTAVVMISDGGTITPLIICVEGKEFIVEVKGCGKKNGGFGNMHFRTGRNILTGGVEAEQAETEFYRLHDDPRSSAPKPLGSIFFNNPEFNDYDQGYILRLTPSTVRAGYTGVDAYPDIESDTSVEKILDVYASLLVDQMFAQPAKILDRSSHVENILLWGNEFAFTDYSDHVAFADKNFPHNDNHGGYMTPKRMLEFYLRMIEEIPGYQDKAHKKKFYNLLTKYFKRHGKSIKLSVKDDHVIVAQKIWESAMAAQVFQARTIGKYCPEGMIAAQKKLIAKSLGEPKEVTYFIEKFELSRTKILTALAVFEARIPGSFTKEKISSMKKIFSEGSTSDVLVEANIFYDVHWKYYKEFTESEGDMMYEAFSFFEQFKYLFISGFQHYLEHEWDVVQTAKKSSVKREDIVMLLSAENELLQKIQEFYNLVDHNFEYFYQMILDSELSKQFFTMNYYAS